MIFQVPIFIFWGSIGNPIIHFIRISTEIFFEFENLAPGLDDLDRLHGAPRRLAQQLVHPPKTLRFSDPTGGALYFDPRGLKIFVVFKR